MKLVVVGGGSAGHVLPAVPIIEKYVARGDEVLFVGTSSGLEEALISELPIKFHSISSGKLRRYFSWQNFADFFRVLIGCCQAVLLLRRIGPDVLFSKGGFVSLPVVFGAWVNRIPVVAHESDLSPGLANRLARRFVRTYCVSFAETQIPGHSVIHTGTPIRSSILEGNAERGRQTFGLSDRPLLLVTGGSLGADHLNSVVVEAVALLTQEYEVVHVVGSGKLSNLRHPGYRQLEYVDQGWGDLLAAASVVVSRAGANALFELLALNKRAVLVPLSRAASRGDQLENVQLAETRQNMAVIREEDLHSESLIAAISQVLDAEAEADYALPDAVAAIVAEIDAVVRS